MWLSSPGGCSPEDGDCTEWRDGRVRHGGKAKYVKETLAVLTTTEESHSELAAGDQHGQEHDGGCLVTSDDH